MDDAPPDTTVQTAKRGRGRPAVARHDPLSVEAVLEAANAVLRTDGLDALSFRRLATDLGVTPTSIYRYVPDKAGLLQLMVDQIWLDVLAGMPSDADDLVEWCIEVNLRIHQVWSEHLELAHFAMAVAEPDDGLIVTLKLMSDVMRAAGFVDVPASYFAIMNFTMGAVAVTAARGRASRYFGRDPDAVQDETRRWIADVGGDPDLMGVMESRFDVGVERHFEPMLRTLVHALVQPERPT